MVFSSLLFLFRFLPVVLLIYYVVPAKLRNLVLLLVSLVFYAWGEPVYVFLMIVSILVSYTGGLLVDHFRRAGEDRKAKLALAAAVAVNSLSGSSIPLLSLTLPIGISFYTFQTISYVIDVYRGNAAVQKNVISYGAYVTMFPQLIAGPIVQYKTIDAQLRSRTESTQEFADGVNRFMIGLGKKVLLANNAGVLWDSIKVQDPAGIPTLTAWIGIAAYTFQIYYDFSGYSDMAIHPYESRSVTEFWRRWHISLGTWFREYVYIPLGGNRKGKWKQIRNIMIVWLLTGIWHGADWNFMIWGVYYGVLLLFEKLLFGKYLEKLAPAVQHIYTMFSVMIGWFIFSFNEITGKMGYLKAMFVPAAGFLSKESIYLLYSNAVLLACLILGSTELPKRLAERLLRHVEGSSVLTLVLRIGFYLGVFLLSVAYLVGASYNPFLYFRF